MIFQKANARKQTGRWARTVELGRSSVWLMKNTRVSITAGLGLQMLWEEGQVLREDDRYLRPADLGLSSTRRQHPPARA